MEWKSCSFQGCSADIGGGINIFILSNNKGDTKKRLVLNIPSKFENILSRSKLWVLNILTPWDRNAAEANKTWREKFLGFLDTTLFLLYLTIYIAEHINSQKCYLDYFLLLLLFSFFFQCNLILVALCNFHQQKKLNLYSRKWILV